MDSLNQQKNWESFILLHRCSLAVADKSLPPAYQRTVNPELDFIFHLFVNDLSYLDEENSKKRAHGRIHRDFVGIGKRITSNRPVGSATLCPRRPVSRNLCPLIGMPGIVW